MTTATREAPETEKIHTERELQKQEATLQETRQKLQQMREREEELSSEIADALEAGEDPAELREEREEIRDWISDMEPVLPVLEDRIANRRRRKLRADAEERLQEIKKKCGGLAGEQDRRIERATEALRRAKEQFEKAGEAHVAGEALRVEAAHLCTVFDLEEPDLRSVPDPAGYEEVRDWRQWKPADVLGTASRMAQGARRAGRGDPIEAMKSLRGLEVALESPALHMLQRLKELESEDE